MKLTISAALAAAVMSATPVLASTLDVSYTGTISYLGTGAGTGAYTVGEIVTGSFLINTATEVVSGSTLAGFSAATVPGTANVTSDQTEALYQQGGDNGTTFTNYVGVDFEATNTFVSTDPVALLQSPTDLANLDLTPGDAFQSTATYTDAATQQEELSANLTEVTVTPVPLPASLWMMLSGIVGLLFARRGVVTVRG